MPYPILDAIEKAAIRDKQTPVEVFFRMQAEFPKGQIENPAWSLGRTLLPTVVPQPMEAGALRSLVPSR